MNVAFLLNDAEFVRRRRICADEGHYIFLSQIAMNLSAVDGFRRYTRIKPFI